ncbi:Dyp-type peroxidase [Shimia biformata]|uniref:Dyp-type peroxidase n=1 Tax=Shimia biformata TaxID=1294299 RepID=UPI0019515B07|nr:hypothetical protein [Shimia biformata]
MSEHFDPDELQGNILRGYKFDRVRYLMLEIIDRRKACGFLALAAEAGNEFVPRITRERQWAPPGPDRCFNIGITFQGLRALGLTAADLAQFPTDFREGMAHRATKIGDVGTSAPTHWDAPFNHPERIHLVASIYSDTEMVLDGVQVQVSHFFNILGTRDGIALPNDKVFFGYRDSISQPKIDAVHDRDQKDVSEPSDPLGTLLLGHPSLHDSVWFGGRHPSVLLKNGTFDAFRVLEQDCAGFESWLSASARVLLENDLAKDLLDLDDPWWVSEGLDLHGALRELVAAQMCGRWRKGTPVESSPESPNPPQGVSLTNFDYNVVSRCPAGAHMRRCNPRGGPIVQRMANYTRRLVRRGMPYGPPFDPKNPDTEKRGLLGNFIGASISAQFEAIMSDWLNLGLQDPEITGSNDPLLGANCRDTSWFDMKLRDGGRFRLHGLPRFVHPRGGAYLFLPSLPAIRSMAAQGL